MTRCRGYTLIELLVVMAIGSALMGTATATLVLVLRAEQAGRRQMVLATALDRLSEQFREDAHGSGRVELLAPGAWQLRQGGGRTVEYRTGADSLIRLERDQGQVVRQEEYALPPGARVTIADVPQGRPPLAVLEVTAPIDATPAIRNARAAAFIARLRQRAGGIMSERGDGKEGEPCRQGPPSV